MNLDRTFCASPDCKGKCDRQLTPEVEQLATRLHRPLSVSFFCGVPDTKEENWTTRGSDQ